jgi:hypothetical protein
MLLSLMERNDIISMREKLFQKSKRKGNLSVKKKKKTIMYSVRRWFAWRMQLSVGKTEQQTV